MKPKTGRTADTIRRIAMTNPTVSSGHVSGRYLPDALAFLTSTMRCPDSNCLRISGSNGANHVNNTRLVQLPIRSQTIGGPSPVISERSTRSSSLVMSTQSSAIAKFRMLPSSDSRSPTSRTAVAAWP